MARWVVHICATPYSSMYGRSRTTVEPPGTGGVFERVGGAETQPVVHWPLFMYCSHEAVNHTDDRTGMRTGAQHVLYEYSIRIL